MKKEDSKKIAIVTINFSDQKIASYAGPSGRLNLFPDYLYACAYAGVLVPAI